jgi:predicted transcriptional regulator of viral defense system
MPQPSPSGVRRVSIVRRIASEFHEMPGLVLTVPQASRFLGVDAASCERILSRLAKHGVLRRQAGGAYARA